MFVKGGDVGDEALLTGMVVVVVLGIEVAGYIVGDDVEFPIPGTNDGLLGEVVGTVAPLDRLLGEVIGAVDCRTPAEMLLGDIVNCAGRGSVV